MPTFPNTGAAPGRWGLRDVRDAAMGGDWPNPQNDPYFSNVGLLLSDNNITESQNNSILDSSGLNQTITINGNPLQGTFSPFGDRWSNYFDGTGDYLALAKTPNLRLTGDFTVEAWVYTITNSTDRTICGFGVNYANGYSALNWRINTSGTLVGYLSTNGSTETAITGGTISTNSWTHVALVRSGSTVTQFVNGVATATGTVSGDLYAGSVADGAAGSYAIGAYYSSSTAASLMVGYISNFKYTRGRALYSSTFTPSTAPLTSEEDTILLTCNTGGFKDSSANNYGITVNGNPTVNKYSPFSPIAPYNTSTIGGSVYFDGTGDYLTVPASSDFYLATGDFTIEAWIYKTTTGKDVIVSQTQNLSSPYAGWIVYIDASEKITFEGSNGVVIKSTSVTVPQNTWVHVAIVKSSSTMTLYQNGVSVNSGTAPNIVNYATNLGIGSYSTYTSGGEWNGYISNLRIVKGTALYTTNFIPSTTPLNSNSNTVLLLNCSNSGIYDGTSNNNVEILGNVKVSNAQSKWHSTSIYFDGTGDYLKISDSPQWFLSSGNFTIEFWYRPTSLSTTHVLAQQGSDVNNRWILYWSTTTGLSFDVASASVQTIACRQGSINGWSINTWHHVCIVRKGNEFCLYRDGFLLTALTDTDVLPDFSGSLYIGGTPFASDIGLMNGYIEDFRITRGTARYTDNFTPSVSKLGTNSVQDVQFNNVDVLVSGHGPNGQQNNVFVDHSKNNFTITANGDATQGTFSPFGDRWSVFFDGNGDSLSLSSNTALAFEGGDFTWECWFNTITPNIFMYGPVNNTFSMSHRTDGKVYLRASNVADVISSGVVSKNAWHHVAVTRAGTTIRIFIDGVLHNSVTNSISFPASTLYIGNDGNNTGAFRGYLSNLRMVKGTALYTTDFVPSTTPLTAVSGTSLLTCQSNRIVDNSTNNFTITKTNEIEVTKYSPFEIPEISSPDFLSKNSSVYFNGTGEYLSLADNVALGLGTNNFTLECWIYPTANPTNGVGTIADFRTASTGAPSMRINNSRQLMFYDGVAAEPSFTSQQVTLNTWNHIAYIRISNVVYGYINGVLAGSVSVTADLGASKPLRIGRNIANGYDFNGYISNFRLIKGTAIYTTTFTPPTSKLTAVSGTSVLTCQGFDFRDNSVNNFAVTVNGNVRADNLNPFNSYKLTGSCYFDGTGDYLSIGSNSLLAPGTGDFTIEAWVYPTAALGTYNNILDTGVSGGLFFGKITNGYGIRRGSVADLVATPATVINQWVHLAASRSGNQLRIFLNGELKNQVTDSSDFVTGAVYVGANSAGGNAWTGYISNLRFVKGTALYTASFTPSIEPATTTANTELLMLGTNSAIMELTGTKTVTTVGNAKISTAQSRWNTSSIQFDGSGDYLLINGNKTFNFNLEDYTAELWFYKNDNKLCTLISQSAADWRIQLQADGTLALVLNSTGAITSIATIINTWYHVAVVKSGTVTSLYLNGVLVGRTTSSATNTTTNFLYVGINPADSAWAFNGYMNDIRISRGAKYTNNFSPVHLPRS